MVERPGTEAHQRTPRRVNYHPIHTTVDKANDDPSLSPTPPQQQHAASVVRVIASSSSSFIAPPPAATLASQKQPPANKRLYRILVGEQQKWVTREIASLDFLLGIPLAAEQEIVKNGWQMQRTKQEEERQSSNDDDDDGADVKKKKKNIAPSSSSAASFVPTKHQHKGAWWEKWIPTAGPPSTQHPTGSSTAMTQRRNISDDELLELEQPTKADVVELPSSLLLTLPPHQQRPMMTTYAPGRRLDGDVAVRVQIPLSGADIAGGGGGSGSGSSSIARHSALRQWELQTAHGLGHNNDHHPPLLDGRLFFSADSSYPVAIYSCSRYAPSTYRSRVSPLPIHPRGRA
jgi:hypothetical protein